jgi:C-terminal processing protease CtpA/Prc
MKRFSVVFAAAAILSLSAAAALAGDYQCTTSTQECLDHMAANFSSYGWAGLEGDYDKEKGLFTVTAIVANSPAAEAGLMEGDVVFGINGTYFAKMDDEDWKASKAERVPGSTANYMIKRDGHKKEVAVALAAMPEDMQAAKLGKHMMDHAEVASVQ